MRHWRCSGPVSPSSRSCPILCADAVQRGRSPFAGRLGDEIASSALAVADDGVVPEGLASAPFDGEGTPRRRTELIGGGRLRAYLHDAYTARRDGGDTESTGNAARGSYRSAPSVSTSNLVVEPGEASRDDLLREAGEGVYVTEVAGLHSGVNPVSGTFSVGAAGRRIKGGELADPVREFTIASDLVAMLSAVAASGSESRWVPFGGSVRTPPLLISEMTVSGS
jgi:PmbA protein